MSYGTTLFSKVLLTWTSNLMLAEYTVGVQGASGEVLFAL